MRNHTIKVLGTQELDVKTLQQVNTLLHLLSPESKDIKAERLIRLLEEQRLILFVAEAQGDIVGILSLCICPTLAQDKLWIEDVVVDESYRATGIGRALVKAAVTYAKSNFRDASIYLTSNPTRKAARALYVSEGFEEYETGVFRMKVVAKDSF